MSNLTLPANSKVSVGTSSTTVGTILKDQMPKTMFFCNTSANTITIGLWESDTATVANEGVVLSPGGTWSYDVYNTGTFQNKDIYITAIATGSSSNLSFSIFK